METRRLSAEPDTIAPDGSEVRLLLSVSGGGLAQFDLPGGQTSVAVVHSTVDEIWFFLRGSGEMWRRRGQEESVVSVDPGVSLTILAGTAFQFRAAPDAPLTAIGVTIPPWPGGDEARSVQGPWSPTVKPGVG
jgi:mannose-6-phosphate isomerase-like protein (cupin superfamily)